MAGAWRGAGVGPAGAVGPLFVIGRTEARLLDNFGALDLRLTPETLGPLNKAGRRPLAYPTSTRTTSRGRFSPAHQALHADHPDRHGDGNDPPA